MEHLIAAAIEEINGGNNDDHDRRRGTSSGVDVDDGDANVVVDGRRHFENEYDDEYDDNDRVHRDVDVGLIPSNDDAPSLEHFPFADHAAAVTSMGGGMGREDRERRTR